jgi:hypothetical protein
MEVFIMKKITMPKVILVGEDALTTADKLMLQYRYQAVGKPFTAVYSYGGLVKVNACLDDADKLVHLMEQGLAREFLDNGDGDMPIPGEILHQFGESAWNAFLDSHRHYWEATRKAKAKEDATAFMAEHERELSDPDVFPAEWDAEFSTELFREGGAKALFLWAYHLGKESGFPSLDLDDNDFNINLDDDFNVNLDAMELPL